MKVPFLIIGGGLSGLAAAIRFARYSPDVLLLEQHHRLGGLNSYYSRNNQLFETGLHAITNYASKEKKQAPLNKLFRQLKLSRKDFVLYPQIQSEIHFSRQNRLLFSNDFALLKEQVCEKFPESASGFLRLVDEIDLFDPFIPSPFRSAKKFLLSFLGDKVLTEMLLCPLMYYGSSVENDMDLSQFIIMFRSIFQEGMFRPAGTMKDFLESLHNHFLAFGGKTSLQCRVKKILYSGTRAHGVELDDGQQIKCDYLLSTVGLSETLQLLDKKDIYSSEKRLGFVESIFLVDAKAAPHLPKDRTILFFNTPSRFNYARPETAVDFDSGVICLPGNFLGRPKLDSVEIRTTHLANFHIWKKLRKSNGLYASTKQDIARITQEIAEKYIGRFSDLVSFQDTFTPLTITRFTAKKEGAIYGCPTKIKDGTIGFSNLFLAGTDQGFLGIVGSMLSGVSMVNQHILPKL